MRDRARVDRFLDRPGVRVAAWGLAAVWFGAGSVVLAVALTVLR